MKINDYEEKTTLVNDDKFVILDSEAGSGFEALKNIKKSNAVRYIENQKIYKFAIRQSGTSAPTISVIRDDFNLESPLSFIYSNTGSYSCDLTPLGDDRVESPEWNIEVSNSVTQTYDGKVLLVQAVFQPDTNKLNIQTSKLDPSDEKGRTLGNSYLRFTTGVTITIAQTIG